MSWVTVIWSMMAAACLMVAAVHGVVGLWRREAWGNLLFALTAVAAAFFAAGELWMMHAVTPDQFATALRWTHVPVVVLVAGLVGFVRLYMRAGRRWLGWIAAGGRAFSLLPNFLTGVSLNYREIAEVQRIPFLGEPVSAPVGVPNPWMIVAQLSSLALVLFLADASVTAWRRGARRKAVLVGGSIVLFVLAGQLQAVLVFWGVIPGPIIVCVFYLCIVAAMGFELSRDVLHAAELSDELRESEQRMTLAVEAANFGIWIRDLARNEIWASDHWRELFGFSKSERLEFEQILQRVHPDDREAVRHAMAKALTNCDGYEVEYRVVLPDGRLRWIAARGRAECDDKGQPILIRGASRDCTDRKTAEEAAHKLSGRLIHAQEDSQRQLARELHDDLSQSLALLSVELEMFGQHPPAEAQKITARMEDFSTQVKGLSSEVHRLSHDLHPAKLDQLGLVAAVRGFCKEFALAHELAIKFVEHDVPRTVPAETALCLYRVAQEALQNVVKHSGGTAAKVELTCDDGHLCLVVTDDGAGFDPQAPRTNGSLGLVSMSERARFVGGRLTIESCPGAGTQVAVRVPIVEAENSAHR